MVDATNLNSFVSKQLADLSYENMVKIYDDNCDGCPFSLIKITKRKRTLTVCNSVDDAIRMLKNITNLGNMDYGLSRGCQYGGHELTLKEIITNTCRFWKVETCEGGQNEIEPSFIEIEDMKEVKVEHDFTII